MKRLAEYTIVIMLALLPAGTAATTRSAVPAHDTATSAASRHRTEKENVPAETALTSGTQTSFIITSEECPVPVLSHTVSRNHPPFQYKESCIHQNLFRLYKKAGRCRNRIFSHRHDKGHYQYHLCQMRI